jgi:MarR family transcriptional regulator, organic hydroperoxide resistance regulator
VTRQFKGDRVVLDEAIGFWLHRAYQSMRNASFRAFRAAVGHEVTPEQWIVLVRLWESDGQRQVDLGDGTFRDRPTMSRILDGMEERGWIERRSDPEDARARRVFLSREGRAMRQKLLPVAKALVARGLGGVSSEELDITLKTLRRIYENNMAE